MLTLVDRMFFQDAAALRARRKATKAISKLPVVLSPDPHDPFLRLAGVVFSQADLPGNDTEPEPQ